MATALLMLVAYHPSAQAAGSIVASTNGRFTEIAGQEASILGDHVIFFVKGYGRAINVGDTLVCSSPDQELGTVAQKFRSNPFTQQYARTIEGLALRGRNWLDAGCVIDASPAGTVAMFKRLGGTLSPLEYPINMPVTDMLPEADAPGEWTAAEEWRQWLVSSRVVNEVDPGTLPSTLRKEWNAAISRGSKAAWVCTDLPCVNEQIQSTTHKLERIQQRAGL